MTWIGLSLRMMTSKKDEARKESILTSKDVGELSNHPCHQSEQRSGLLGEEAIRWRQQVQSCTGRPLANSGSLLMIAGAPWFKSPTSQSKWPFSHSSRIGW